LYLHPFITEITCDLSLVGVDGAGHSLSFQVASELPIFQPGIDFYSPTAVISVTPDVTGTVPFAVVFDASGSFDVGSGIADINWDFGDESTGIDITESHTYATPGSYSVTLTVTDFYGNKGYATVIITVNEAEAPTAVINVTPGNTGIAPFKVYFDAYESHADPACGFGCEIVSYEWDFGDGDTGTGVTLNHTYSNIGTYMVVLTVTDSNGKKGYANVEVTVTKEPTAVINTVPDPPNGVAPFIVYFDAYESTSESGIVSYEWDFGDGSDTGDGITVDHTYNTVGTYIVYLTITDSNEYEAYDSVTITVNETPDTTPTLSARITITNLEQEYYEFLGEWSMVYIYYVIENTGSTDIDNYTIYFTITCEDETEYYDSWFDDFNIGIGQQHSDYALGDSWGKEVVSVEITDLELNTF
jgi:PKD repeat protein